MYRNVAADPLFLLWLPNWLRLAACLGVLTALAACGSHPTQQARKHYNPSHYYPPPGPSSDPWGPYIREASGRFRVPELWIRGVMRQESGGQEDVISWAGAMGLMQVMPDTYDGLRSRYSLGTDPFDPHNNILAGTAYLKEMYDRYGSPGFLAAYNAGPNRLERYLNSGAPLPAETVNYVASIAPHLGTEIAMSGPLAVYGGGATRFAARSTPGGCDPDAAYNPGAPCTPYRPPVVAVAAITPLGSRFGRPTPAGCDPDAAFNPNGACTPLAPVPIAVAEAGRSSQSGCDPDAAFNPNGPCTPLRPAPVAASYPTRDCDADAAYDPTRPCRPVSVLAHVAPQPEYREPPVYASRQPEPRQRPSERLAYASPRPQIGQRATYARPMQEMAAQPAAFTPWTPPGRWAIQVGAFANLASAQAAAENARASAPDLLRTAKMELPTTTPFGSQVAFQARMFGLTASAAADACGRLRGRGMVCMTVPPRPDSY